MTRSPVLACLVLALGGCFASSNKVADVDTDSSAGAETSETGDRTSLTSTDGGSNPTTTGVTDPSATTSDEGSDTSDTNDTNSTSATTSDTNDTTSDTGEPPLGNCRGFDGTIAYVNFGGASLELGAVDNAPAKITSDATLAGDWPPYAEDDAAMVFELMQPHWAPFDICLTMEEPDALDYEMIVVQSEAYQGNDNILSLTGPDCGNTANNNVTVLFLASGLNLPAITKAIAISKQLAHLFGLDAVDDDGDLMNQFVAMTLNGASFTDSCIPLIVGATCAGGVSCNEGSQDASEMLTDVLGIP